MQPERSFDFLNELTPESKTKLNEQYILNNLLMQAASLFINKDERYIPLVMTLHDLLEPILSYEAIIKLKSIDQEMERFIMLQPRINSDGKGFSQQQMEDTVNGDVMRFTRMKFRVIINEMSKNRMWLYKRLFGTEGPDQQQMGGVSYE